LNKTKLITQAFTSHNIGISLSGGAFRGLAHIGMLMALDEHGINPQVVSGTSAGAIVGSFYAAGYSPYEMQQLAIKTNFIPYLKPTLPLQSLMTLEKLGDFIEKYIGKLDLSVLPKKLVVCATNLQQGCPEYFSKGELSLAVMASSALPFLFQPVTINDTLYIDGGVMNNLPVEPLLGKVDHIIGINVNPVGFEPRFTNLFSIMARSFVLAIRSNTEARIKLCDSYLMPSELVRIRLFYPGDTGETIKIGYNYTKKFLESALP